MMCSTGISNGVWNRQADRSGLFPISRKNDFGVKEILSPYTSRRNRSLPEALSRINAASGTKFIVIIDEWDVLIRDEAADLKTQEEYINFLRAMFKGTEPTKYIQLAYLTGILPL